MATLYLAQRYKLFVEAPKLFKLFEHSAMPVARKLGPTV